jgi:hypothetical protein
VLENKSLHQLRAIAQSFGVKDIFTLEANKLIQEIGLKQQALMPAVDIVPPRPDYDMRILGMNKRDHHSREVVTALLQPLIDKGLKLEFIDGETWQVSFDKKTDTGSLKLPLRVILVCAEKVLR